MTEYPSPGGGLSRTGEFESGSTGSGGANYHIAQPVHPDALPSSAYRPSSVLSPIGGSGIGQSAATFSQHRMLNYYNA